MYWNVQQVTRNPISNNTLELKIKELTDFHLKDKRYAKENWVSLKYCLNKRQGSSGGRFLFLRVLFVSLKEEISLSPYSWGRFLFLHMEGFIILPQ